MIKHIITVENNQIIEHENNFIFKVSKDKKLVKGSYQLDNDNLFIFYGEVDKNINILPEKMIDEIKKIAGVE